MKKEQGPSSALRATVCCAQSPEPTAIGCHIYCTRERGHDGEHIAQAGDHTDSLLVVGRWTHSPAVFHQHGFRQPSMLVPLANDILERVSAEAARDHPVPSRLVIERIAKRSIEKYGCRCRECA